MALLTHEDSVTNIKLAAISRDIAAATKEDGSAMKTISIMTMLFLPATFFAALFSMPSLGWGDKFWLYWAITVPSTVLVFSIWAVINNWSRMWKRNKDADEATL
jgi:Mg2+ and Co2+ transporter CorA